MTRYSIAIAVLDNNQLTAVLNVGTHLDDLLITAEESQISIGLRITDTLKINTRTAVIEIGVVVIRTALVVIIRHIINEVLGVILDIDITAGESIHCTDKALYFHGLERIERLEINTRRMSKGLRRIISAQGHPVMIGTAINRLLRMLCQYGFNIHTGNAFFQTGGNIIKVFLLIDRVFLTVSRRIVFTCQRGNHRIDTDVVIQFITDFIQRIYIGITRTAAEHFQSTIMAILIHDNNTVLDFIFRILFTVIAGRAFRRFGAFRFAGFRLAGLTGLYRCRTLGRRRRCVLFRCLFRHLLDITDKVYAVIRRNAE